jgi:hypothetical protein
MRLRIYPRAAAVYSRRASSGRPVTPNAGDKRSVAAGDLHFARSARGAARQSSKWMQLGIGFVLSASLGFFVQSFAIRTKLYDTVADNKLKRRVEMDEMVAELRTNIAAWQEEDRKAAEAREERRAAA